MHNRENPNLDILQLVVECLGDLIDEMVFLGGCATGLLLTDEAAPPIRVTGDVDVITEATTLGDYHRLSASLRERDFREDQSDDAPVCRWVTDGVVLDVMLANPPPFWDSGTSGINPRSSRPCLLNCHLVEVFIWSPRPIFW